MSHLLIIINSKLIMKPAIKLICQQVSEFTVDYENDVNSSTVTVLEVLRSFVSLFFSYADAAL